MSLINCGMACFCDSSVVRIPCPVESEAGTVTLAIAENGGGVVARRDTVVCGILGCVQGLMIREHVTMQASEAAPPSRGGQLPSRHRHGTDAHARRSEDQAPEDAAALDERIAPGCAQIRVCVLLAQDRGLLASSIEVVLGLEPDLEVVAVGSSPSIQLAQVSRLSVPDADVILVDDVSLTPLLRDVRPEVKVLVLEAAGDPEITLASIQAGASACISETTSPAALTDIIRRVYAGEAVYEQRILIELVRRSSAPRPMRPLRAATLSARELDVLRELSTGASSAEAAERLCISLNTVRTHLKNILSKLDARSKLEAVIIAIRHGWIDLPPESP